MKKIDPQTPLWKLTVEEFLEIIKNLNSGMLDEAIIQKGKIIIIDKQKVLELFGRK